MIVGCFFVIFDITHRPCSFGQVRPRRSSSHDMWYLGCLGLELTARASLAGWPHGRVGTLFISR